jgi:hypothetical protein
MATEWVPGDPLYPPEISWETLVKVCLVCQSFWYGDIEECPGCEAD